MFQFSRSGLLTPNKPIKATVLEMEQEFVINVPCVERNKLFNSYLHYSNDLKSLCKGNILRQWLDGSFVTKKLRPNDIDIVTFIDFSILNEIKDEIKRFVFPNSIQYYAGIDAYIVSVFPTTDTNYHLYGADELYWLDQFDSTRRNRQGIKAAKGFLEINF